MNINSWERWIAGKLNRGGRKAETPGSGIKKQRCLIVHGQKIGCVEDQAAVKVGPGLWVLGALVLLLVMKR